MNLNLYIVRDYIEHPIARSELHSNRLERNITGISFFRSGQPVKEELVYIIAKEDLERAGRNLPSCAYVCLGSSMQTVPNTCDVLFLEGVGNPEDAYDLIGRVMLRFDNWEHALYQLLLESASLREMGDCSLEFFENPISLYTNSHRNVFFCEKVKDAKLKLFDEGDVGTYLPQDDIDRMTADPEFIASVSATEPGLFSENEWGYRILFYNIRFSGVYVARIMACETERPIRDSDYSLLEYLAGFVSIAVRNKDINLNDHPRDFDALVKMLLDGNETEAAQIQIALNSFGWLITDRFFCVAFDMSGHDQTVQAMSGLCARLESSLSGCAALFVDGLILLIADVGEGKTPRDNILSEIETFRGSGLPRAGASCEFDDFRKLAAYAGQARTALRLGIADDARRGAQDREQQAWPGVQVSGQQSQKRKSTAWCYRYEDFMLADFIDGARGSKPSELLVPQGLRKLMDYDSEHGRSFTETLRVYLENDRSAVKTTHALFIQRATFVYQLKRIKEITGFDLDDSDTRLLLRIAFAMQHA